jgi:hypothetical protein
MDAIGWFGMAGIALVGQWFNRYQSVPGEAVKAALAVIGLAFYALGHGLPNAWWGEGLSEWLNPALLWALALPGAASMIGTAPGMKTDSQP